jgi:hypothetical protein
MTGLAITPPHYRIWRYLKVKNPCVCVCVCVCVFAPIGEYIGVPLWLKMNEQYSSHCLLIPASIVTEYSYCLWKCNRKSEHNTLV